MWSITTAPTGGYSAPAISTTGHPPAPGPGAERVEPRSSNHRCLRRRAADDHEFAMALGPPIRWEFASRAGGPAAAPAAHSIPHAMREANAYDSRPAAPAPLRLFPGETTRTSVQPAGHTIFTCLSHDIVAHETTHPLVDGQRGTLSGTRRASTLGCGGLVGVGGGGVGWRSRGVRRIVRSSSTSTRKEALLETIRRTVRPDPPRLARLPTSRRAATGARSWGRSGVGEPR
jgi:hypothetical protein